MTGHRYMAWWSSRSGCYREVPGSIPGRGSCGVSPSHLYLSSTKKLKKRKEITMNKVSLNYVAMPLNIQLLSIQISTLSLPSFTICPASNSLMIYVLTSSLYLGRSCCIMSLADGFTRGLNNSTYLELITDNHIHLYIFLLVGFTWTMMQVHLKLKMVAHYTSV